MNHETGIRAGRRGPAAWLAMFAVAIAVALPAAASANALDQFKTFVATTKSAKGEFTQRRIAEPGGKSTASRSASGSFVFERPGKFVWTYRQPYVQVLQADGEKLYIYDKDLNQVTIKKLGNALGSSPAAILFGSNELEKNFTLKDSGSKDGLEWLQATPKTKDTTFERIGIGMKDGLPRAMELHDTFGQVTLLSFSDFEKNPPIGDKLFKFTVPKGADVFQQ